MMNATVERNVPVTIAITKGTLSTVLPGNVTVDVLSGDTSTPVIVPAVEALPGFVTLEYTPTTLGMQHLHIDGRLIAHLEVIPKALHTSLETLSDVALGSWSLNKVTGLLTLYTQLGAEMATYNVLDNTDVTSRERL